MTTYRITIQAAQNADGYIVSGSTIMVSPASIIDAARALLRSGADPRDMLHVECGDVTVVPRPIGRFAGARLSSVAERPTKTDAIWAAGRGSRFDLM